VANHARFCTVIPDQSAKLQHRAVLTDTAAFIFSSRRKNHMYNFSQNKAEQGLYPEFLIL